MPFLDRVVTLLDLDPFAYLVVTIFGVLLWTWCNVFGDFALTGRGIWLRWLGLFLAGAGAALFAYTARGLS